MFELIHTSAPKGLKEGSSGFCPVAWTIGMPANLIGPLEQLSGYKPIFQPNSPEAGRNPVSCSFMIAPVGGRKRELLSRIAYAGLDYSGRSNKIAHHILPEAEDRPAEGPVAILLNNANFITAWNREPEVLPMRRPSVAAVHLGIAVNWQQTMADAGWAGVIAEWFKQGREYVHVIFPVGMDMLPLVEEISMLLNQQDRWLFTFNTYFIALAPGAECFLRFCIEGSEVAVKVKRLTGNLVIDLSEPKPIPAEMNKSPLVFAARTGELTPLPAVEKAKKLTAECELKPGNELQPQQMPDSNDGQPSRYSATTENIKLEYPPRGNRTITNHRTSVPVNPKPIRPPIVISDHKYDKRKMVIPIPAIIVAALIVLGLGCYFLTHKREEPEQISNLKTASDQEAKKLPATPVSNNQQDENSNHTEFVNTPDATAVKPPASTVGTDDTQYKPMSKKIPEKQTEAAKPVTEPAVHYQKPEAGEPALIEQVEFLANWEKIKRNQEAGIKDGLLWDNGNGPLWIEFSEIGKVEISSIPYNSVFMEVSNDKNRIDVYAITKDKIRKPGSKPVLSLFIKDNKLLLSVPSNDNADDITTPRLAKITEIIVSGKKLNTSLTWDEILAKLPPSTATTDVSFEGNNVVLVYKISDVESKLNKIGKIEFAGPSGFVLDKKNAVPNTIRYVKAGEKCNSIAEDIKLMKEYNHDLDNANKEFTKDKNPKKSLSDTITSRTNTSWTAIIQKYGINANEKKNPGTILSLQSLVELSGKHISSKMMNNSTIKRTRKQE